MIVMDCSTVGKDTERDLYGQLNALGVGFLDCPVSGGVEGASTASLAIMCGGDESVFNRARPILEKMGKAVAYLGASGSGQVTKATNQIMCAGIIQAVGEAMAFAHEEGVDLKKVIDVLGKGAGSSWYFVNRAPFMANNQFPRRIPRETPRQGSAHLPRHGGKHGGVLPVVESTLEEYGKLIAAGLRRRRHFGDLPPEDQTVPSRTRVRCDIPHCVSPRAKVSWLFGRRSTSRRCCARRIPGLEIELVPLLTQGDRIQDRTLAAIGGKGLFIKELEVALEDTARRHRCAFDERRAGGSSSWV